MKHLVFPVDLLDVDFFDEVRSQLEDDIYDNVYDHTVGIIEVNLNPAYYATYENLIKQITNETRFI